MTAFSVAVIAGDGIGQEIMPPTLDLLSEAAALEGAAFEYTHLDWSTDTYLETGSYIPSGGLDLLRRHDAIFLGAVGDPRVPDHESLWGLLLPIRQSFRLAANVRPIWSVDGVESPLRRDRFDLVIVRENSEGEYTAVGGSVFEGSADQIVTQTALFTRRGIERIARYAFDLAMTRRRRVTSATKSNALAHSMPYWDQVVAQVAAEYPEVEYRWMHVDALAGRMILRPEEFDVIVASNLFGDILADLGAAMMGSIGFAPSASIDPEGQFPPLFEPVHGSAPDIVGRGIANPSGQLFSGVMMLRTLGLARAAQALDEALRRVLADPRNHTPDLGGAGTCEGFAAAVRGELARADAHQR